MPWRDRRRHARRAECGIIVDPERGANARSTVGTATDAHALLRIVFSRLGRILRRRNRELDDALSSRYTSRGSRPTGPDPSPPAADQRPGAWPAGLPAAPICLGCGCEVCPVLRRTVAKPSPYGEVSTLLKVSGSTPRLINVVAARR